MKSSLILLAACCAIAGAAYALPEAAGGARSPNSMFADLGGVNPPRLVLLDVGSVGPRRLG